MKPNKVIVNLLPFVVLALFLNGGRGGHPEAAPDSVFIVSDSPRTKGGIQAVNMTFGGR